MTSFWLPRAFLAVVAIVALSGCKPLDDGMVLIFGRSMRDQRSFDPYENTLRAPEGVSVPRLTQADLGVPGIGSLVVQGLTNPLDLTDPRSRERGAELYTRFCTVCHGEDGVGANASIADKHPMLPAYNLSGAQVAAYSDQYLYAMIRVGRGLMPEYGSRITHFDRWSIVNHVRALQLQAGNAPENGMSGDNPPAGE